MSHPATAEAPAAVLHAAKVIWYNQVQGFGFLAVEGYPHDLFIHNREVREAKIGIDDLAKGSKLKCSIGADNKGRPVATDLQVDRG